MMHRVTGKRLAVTVLAALPFLAAATPAGRDDGTRPATGGAGYLLIGASVLDCGGLNAALAGNGYSRFKNTFTTVGGGGHAVIGRLILGGEGQSFHAAAGGNAGFKASLAGGAGFFNIGWILFDRGGFRTYPFAGLGAGSLSLNIESRTPVSFEEVAADPKRGARLQTSGFLLNLGMAAEKWLSGRGGRRGFFIGLRAGYVAAPVRSGWELDRLEIEGGPKLNLGGPYLRIVLGAGSPPRRQ